MYKPNRKFDFYVFRILLIFFLIAFWRLNLFGQEAIEATSEELVEQPEPWWVWNFLGRLHPLMVHFPIGLLVIAGIMELAKLRTFESKLRAGTNWLVYIGAAGSVLAVLLGLLLANSGSYSGETFEWHQWAGITTAILAVVTAFLLYAINKYNKRSLIIGYRTFLMITVLGVFMAGHYGGSLTHGQDYLLSATPWAPNDENLEGIEGGMSSADFDFASYTNETDSLTLEQQVNLNLAVRTILAHHCFQCHSSDKMEGELRLDDKELVFKGGESGKVIIPGDSKGSELVRRITLPAGHKEAMPGKGKPLGEKDIALVKLWIDKGAPWPDQAKGIFRVAPLAPRKPELPAATNGLENPIDRLVNAYFVKNKIEWQEVVDDRTFLRRIYFDLIGLPPSEQELLKFEADASADKRTKIAQELLTKDHEYATHWTTFWNDLLRNDYTGTGYITQGRFNISPWLYQSLQNNKPYNEFAMELIDPSEESKGFIKGIAWRGAVNSSQTTAMQAAQNVSQALLGVNLKCASCHDSFVSDWKLDDAYAFANIFSEEALEINRCDIPTGKMADTRILWPELGEISKNGSVKEKSKELSTLLTKPENGRLYRTLVNRIWAQLMGRGIVAPVDEMDKKPWSQDLLDWLAVNFVEQGYDIRQLLYLITTSKTYQLPSHTIKDPSEINSESFVFKGTLKRKLTAEQFADAVSSVVDPVYTLEALKYNPFENSQAYASASPFVRAALVQNDPFLTALGRPSRENITTSREGQVTLLQAMELTNGTKLNETLVKGSKKWVAKYGNPEQLIQAIYSQSLGRKPSQKEFEIAKKLMGNKMEEESVQELLWAIVLLPEFQFIE
jgi:uncharacterized membrane protein/mono/diheme cytochrome c family protein